MPADVAAERPIRVVVADDHPMYRRSVAAAITDHPQLQLVGEAATGTLALEQIAVHSPDLALLDLRMPDLDGFAVLAALTIAEGSPRVLFLSAFGDSATVHRALEAGAAGFLSKDADEQEICSAIVAVVREGQTVVSAQLQQGVLARIRQQGASNRLSARECQILQGVAAGQQLAEIGVQLSLSPSTVKTYLHRAYDKLGVSDRAAAVAEAFKRGLL